MERTLVESPPDCILLVTVGMVFRTEERIKYKSEVTRRTTNYNHYPGYGQVLVDKKTIAAEGGWRPPRVFDFIGECEDLIIQQQCCSDS